MPSLRSSRPAGTRLSGRYVLGDVLGQGGSATVYDALDEATATSVAVKVLDPEPPHRDADRARMLREVRLTASIGHPGIVRVLDGGPLDDGSVFLVMEKLSGRTLADRLDECFWLPLDEAMAVAAQLLDALGAAHEAGVVHRDVKPSNVFLLHATGRPRIKLIDFGLGMNLGDPGGRVTDPDIVVGTLGYMPPELLFGDDPTVRSDVYAVGATLYEMLAGRRALQPTSANVRSVLSAMRGPLDPIGEVRPALPTALADGIMRALAPRPADRHPSCRAMAEACGLAGALAA
jgi:serine/threonine-protein kinase